MFVKSMEAAVAVAQSFGKERYVEARYCGLGLEDPAGLIRDPDRLAPVFQTSNVTGEGLDFVRIRLVLCTAPC